MARRSEINTQPVYINESPKGSVFYLHVEENDEDPDGTKRDLVCRPLSWTVVGEDKVRVLNINTRFTPEAGTGEPVSCGINLTQDEALALCEHLLDWAATP